MGNSSKFAFVLLCVFIVGYTALSYAATLQDHVQEHSDEQRLEEHHRKRRQFDIRLSAEHDDKEDETELALEAIANLWRSSDGKTQIEGSTKVIHQSSSLNSGNTRYSANLHVHHDYKRK